VAGIELETMKANQCPCAIEIRTRRHSAVAAGFAPERDQGCDCRIECASARPRDLHGTPDDGEEFAADDDALAGLGFEATKFAVRAVITHHAIERGDSLERQARRIPGLRVVCGVERQTYRQAHVDLRKLVQRSPNLRRLQSDRRKNDPNRA
jgi:hypothetical protein